MSDDAQTSKAGETEYSMVVNGSLVVVPHAEVSYEEVTSIAYPVPPAPDAQFRVTYDRAEGSEQSGTLGPGDVVRIKVDGTTFEVSASGAYEIDVNTVEFKVPNSTVTYDQVVDLAYPNGREDPNAMFQIDYANAHQKPKDGELDERGSVAVKAKGTEFIVIRSIRS